MFLSHGNGGEWSSALLISTDDAPTLRQNNEYLQTLLFISKAPLIVAAGAKAGWTLNHSKSRMAASRLSSISAIVRRRVN